MGMKPTHSLTCIRLNGSARRKAVAVCRVALALSAFATLTACEQNSFVPPPPPKVDVGVPVKQTVTRFLEATGNTAPIKNVDLVARVQGFLQSINYQDGDFVKQGTTLFTIEPDTYKLKLEQAQAAEQNCIRERVGCRLEAVSVRIELAEGSPERVGRTPMQL